MMNDARFEPHLYLTGEKEVPYKIKLQKRKGITVENKVRSNWHQNLEIMYVTSGKGQVYCGTRLYDVSIGDIFVVNANLPHEVLSVSGIEFYYLIIAEWFCEENEINTKNVYFEEVVEDDEAKRLFQSVLQECFNEHTYKNAGVKATILKLLVYLARNHVVSTVGPRCGLSAKEASIQSAIGYIVSHIDEKLSVDDIAEKVGLSRYYFMREFKKSTGETLMSYIHKIRCENAKKMLWDSRHTIQEIGEKSGFEDFSYFCSSFKKYTGMTPSGFRQSLKKHNFNNNEQCD